VPRWLCGWALVAAVAYLIDAGLVLFDVLTVGSSVHGLLMGPLALNELTKGFSR
jgi:hypothetical protein